LASLDNLSAGQDDSLENKSVLIASQTNEMLTKFKNHSPLAVPYRTAFAEETIRSDNKQNDGAYFLSSQC